MPNRTWARSYVIEDGNLESRRRKAIGGEHTRVCVSSGMGWARTRHTTHDTRHTIHDNDFLDGSRLSSFTSFRIDFGSRPHQSIASAWECIGTRHCAFVQHISPPSLLSPGFSCFLYFSLFSLLMGRKEPCILYMIPGVLKHEGRGASGNWRDLGLGRFIT